ncbi:hypothetical protein HK44_008955 [Pseudomonas fluorescens HK44]|uniref:Uncharacterized protein n=1 Tax=Pseudomonas fluorescens HK44 TaxID=1042209 RepID=A0A010ST61_PSEFL|nr:hypothetical protein HK44_008955 [Pseudomonas fluorescens HK44]
MPKVDFGMVFLYLENARQPCTASFMYLILRLLFYRVTDDRCPIAGQPSTCTCTFDRSALLND